MKKIIKIITIVLLVFTFSCDEGSDSDFKSDPTTGWVEFNTESTTLSFQTTELNIPLTINVPIYEDGLNISYTLEAVQGNFSGTVNTGNNIFVDPFDTSRSASIDLNFSNAADLSEVLIFDVVLTGVDASGVSVGLRDGSSVTKHRITIWNTSHFAGTYSVSEQFTAGGNAPFGLTDFFGESYEVELTLMPGESNKYSITDNLDFYFFFDTAVITLLDNGEVAIDDDNGAGFPVVGLFRVFEYTSSSYDFPFEITCSGPLSTFGPYEFVLTKQ